VIRLDSDVRKLEAVLSGAVATSQPVAAVSYTDAQSKVNNKKDTGLQASVFNSTTAVSICDAPARGIYREIELIQIRNADSASATVTIRMNDNGTTLRQVKFSIRAGDFLQYTHGNGWQVLDSTGRLR
jgi:hypothetical protein